MNISLTRPNGAGSSNAKMRRGGRINLRIERANCRHEGIAKEFDAIGHQPRERLVDERHREHNSASAARDCQDDREDLEAAAKEEAPEITRWPLAPPIGSPRHLPAPRPFPAGSASLNEITDHEANRAGHEQGNQWILSRHLDSLPRRLFTARIKVIRHLLGLRCGLVYRFAR